MKQLKNGIILSFLAVVPFICIAQQKGVRFETGLSWKQLKEKSRSENKYLFVDCMATWCGPCKMMDRVVYTNDSVRDVMSQNFIAVKVQMDTSKNDDSQTKSWYSDASAIAKAYEITAYPTFLFFSPKGELVHKGVGYKDVQEFITLSLDALNPKRQYLTLVRDYEQGRKDYAVMPSLANKAILIGDSSLAKKIADDYINNYLLRLENEKLYTRGNMEFLLLFAGSPSTKGFKFLYEHAERVSKVLNDSTGVKSFIVTVISKAEIDPAIISAAQSSADSPDWQSLRAAIKSKYNEYYADRTVIDAKARWYAWKKNWPEFTKNTVQYLNKFGADLNNFDINDRAWNVFPYVADKKELEDVIYWMEKVVKTETDSTNLLPAALDTYANFLHKAGRTEEAIPIEEKAFNMSIEYKMAWYTTAEMYRCLKNMKKGKPTWIREEE